MYAAVEEPRQDITQWTKGSPLGALGSSQMRAIFFVPSDGPFRVSGGDIF